MVSDREFKLTSRCFSRHRAKLTAHLRVEVLWLLSQLEGALKDLIVALVLRQNDVTNRVLF